MLIAFQQTHQMFAKLWLARERLELAFSLKEPDRTLLKGMMTFKGSVS
jgi:hypothetical protein